MNEHLLEAVKEGKVSEMKDKGASANAKEGQGWTALMWASFYDHVDVARTLLAEGARVEEHDGSGKTVLIWAAEGGHADVLRCGQIAEVGGGRL